MKKIVFMALLVISVLGVQNSRAALPFFYYDQSGQLNFSGTREQNNCFQKGYYYWNGHRCAEVVPIKKCISQGGEWHQVQMVTRQYMRNICICKNRMFWNGTACVNRLPSSKQCKIEVWCDKKMKDIIVNVTPEVMELNTCP